MSLGINIFLWTTSLTIGTTGIIFGIIASINAHRANKQIHGLISATWIVQETERFFFKNIKEAITKNQKLIRRLSGEKSTISFLEYSILSSPTRLAPLPKFTFNALKSSDYKELVIKYLNHKVYLDKQFFNCFEEPSILKSRKIMNLEQKEKVLVYHQSVLRRLKSIVKQYSNIHAVLNKNVEKKAIKSK